VRACVENNLDDDRKSINNHLLLCINIIVMLYARVGRIWCIKYYNTRRIVRHPARPKRDQRVLYVESVGNDFYYDYYYYVFVSLFLSLSAVVYTCSRVFYAQTRPSETGVLRTVELPPLGLVLPRAHRVLLRLHCKSTMDSIEYATRAHIYCSLR
jgi:hypothetical protein